MSVSVGVSLISILGAFAMTSDEWHESLKPHATAIGFVCIKWAWLEMIVEVFANHLCGLEIGAIESQVLGPNIDFRAKIAIVRHLASAKRLSDDWYSSLLEIDNKIRIDRNRIVHDIWNPPDGRFEHPTRTHARTKQTKPQARRPALLTTHEVVEMPVSDIVAIGNAITAASNQLLDLGKMMPAWPSNTA